MIRALAGTVLAVGLACGAGQAAVLRVGPDEALKAPSDAARVAQDGDTVEIAPGEYFDCAIWRQGGLTITGPQDPATPAVLSDQTCQGKAIFVIGGHGVTVRHLTFTRARVPDGNGAGIRAEGRGLVVEHSRFVNNESAILSAQQPEGVIAVRDSVFERNGAGEGPRCVPTLAISVQARLTVERSSFGPARGCDTIRARDVARTEVLDSRFADGPATAERNLVLQEGGSLLVRDSHFTRGPQAVAATVVYRDLSGRGGGATVRGSVLENGSGRRLVLLHSIAPAAPVVADNRIGRDDVELDQSGYWRALARGTARSGIDLARDVVGKAKRVVRALIPH